MSERGERVRRESERERGKREREREIQRYRDTQRERDSCDMSSPIGAIMFARQLIIHSQKHDRMLCL